MSFRGAVGLGKNWNSSQNTQEGLGDDIEDANHCILNFSIIVEKFEKATRSRRLKKRKKISTTKMAQ